MTYFNVRTHENRAIFHETLDSNNRKLLDNIQESLMDLVENTNIC